MQKRTMAALAGSVLALTAVGGTAANAGGLIGSHDVKDGSLRGVDIKDGTVRTNDLGKGIQAKLKTVGTPGSNGSNGTDGNDGAPGAKGAKGDKGDKGDAGTNAYEGAYYAVAFYNAGDTNAGAVASVACKSTDDHAVSGGVQTLGLDDTPLDNNTPVASSFPGRMDWSTNTPKENRLDGWIVQFGGNAGAVSDKAPEKVKVWALCMPDTQIPIVETFRQAG